MAINATMSTGNLDLLLKRVIASYGPRRFLNTVGIALVAQIDKNFRTESNNGKDWRKFKYGGRLVGKGRGTRMPIGGVFYYLNTDARLLRKTGRLAGSYGQKFTGSSRLIVDSSVEYAKYYDADSNREILPTKKNVNEVIKKVAEEISRSNRV